MIKYICIRDDDTNYFTEQGELKECYGEFWGKIPITLATIPFVHGSDRRILQVPDQRNKYRSLREWEVHASAEELDDYHHIFPVGLNKELVNELRLMISQGMVEIAQHGVNHKYTEFGEEMLGDRMGFCAVRDGKEYLEKTFGQRIGVFIPPANTIDTKCISYLKRLDLELFSCGSIIFVNPIDKALKSIIHPKDTIASLKARRIKVNTPVRSRGGYVITGSITYDAEKNRKDIQSIVRKSLELYGFASVTTHYRLLSDRHEKGKRYNYRENFHELLGELMSLNDVEFIRASEYIERARKKFL